MTLLETIARKTEPAAWEDGGSAILRNRSLRHVKRVLDAIAAAGLVIVPRRPTPQMVHAAIGWREIDNKEGFRGEHDMFERAYRAMIAAAREG
jgi:hypothetical protein